MPARDFGEQRNLHERARYGRADAPAAAGENYAGDYGADWGPQRSSLHQSLDLYGDRVGDAGGASPEMGAHDYENRGRGPRGYQRSDERIREDVCELLTDDPRLDASDLEVSVEACEVTLSGAVTSREAKRLAERLVDGVHGVRDVHNRLRVATLPSERRAAG